MNTRFQNHTKFNMNVLELVEYYKNNKNEFIEEAGHNKLLIGLKKYIPQLYEESKDNKIIGIDVGTCIGEYLPNFIEIFKESNKEILCFEPNPVNINKLETKLVKKYYNDFKLFKCCLSNETTNSTFYNWKNMYNNNTGNQNAGLRSGGTKICDVEVKKLDDILDNTYPDGNIIIKFIKIDTEGNDSNVIKGFQKYLPKTQYIIFECSDCLDDIRGPGIPNPMFDIVSFLSINGFDTYRIGTRKLFKVNDEYWHQTYDDIKFWSNCFAIKKNDNLIHKLIDHNFDYLF